jgi:hypothetical protein
MTQSDDAFAAAQRRRFTRENAHLYVRHDAKLFMEPAAHERWLREREAKAAEFAPDAALAAETKALLRLKAEVAALRAEIKFRKLLAALKEHQTARKALSPNHWELQPRVPKHNPDGGQWTRVAGGPPAIGHNQGPPLDDIPQKRPSTAQERNRLAREVARNPKYLPLLAFILVGGAHWLAEKYHEFRSNQDPPKPLDELHEAVGNGKKGYVNHHVVLQGPAKDRGFPDELIQGRDNVVRIPTWKHWEIHSWYETPNLRYRGLRPREALQNKSWEEQRRVGLEILVRFGVLKR